MRPDVWGTGVPGLFAQLQPSGFALAVAVLIGMAAALIYTVAAVARGAGSLSYCCAQPACGAGSCDRK